MTFRADEYKAAAGRYRAGMPYRRVGRSGLDLPAISLGLWHNFGDDVPLERQQAILRRAFDRGVTHFDLANNYGPPYGSAETQLRAVFARDFRPYRDELVISSKAGYDMWPGPYGQGGGSRKYLSPASTSRSRAMGLDYVDIFYSHRFDETTPLEETMGALDSIVRSGKALYAGISSYSGARTREAVEILRAMGTPLLIHQPSYSMINRWVEQDLLDVLGETRRRLHRVLAAGAGDADEQVPQGHPRRLARGPGQEPGPVAAHRGPAAPDPRPGPDRPGSRPDPRPDGVGVGAARPAGDLGPRRCLQCRAARRQPRRGQEPRASPRPSWPRSTSMPSIPVSTSGRPRRTSEDSP